MKHRNIERIAAAYHAYRKKHPDAVDFYTVDYRNIKAAATNPETGEISVYAAIDNAAMLGYMLGMKEAQKQ